MGIWNTVDKVTSPTWNTVSENTSPTWSTLTISNSITYKRNYEPTPSMDIVNDWNLISDKWEHFSYEWEDLII